MNLFIVFLLAMTPIGELRLSVPTGIGAGLNWYSVFLFSILGNMVPAIVLVYTLPLLEKLRNRQNFFLWRWFDQFLIRVEKKQQMVDKYGWIGLLLLVAIPFPGTGAYTGSVVSYMLRMEKKKSLFFIFVGLLIAGTVMTLASKGIIHVFF